MKLDDRVQSIKATRPSNREFATYGLPGGYAACIWASEGPASGPVYLWVELDYPDPPEVWYRVYSTRAQLRLGEWELMKKGGRSDGMVQFKARRKLAKGRYVLQARFLRGKKEIMLQGITFRVL